MKKAWSVFWAWYERHYLFNVSLAAGLFLLQIAHLIWLLFDVVIPNLGGPSLIDPQGLLLWLLIVVDYTEIPALISVSLLYIHELYKNFSWRPVWYLAAINTQWLHLFWITDEFVLSSFETVDGMLPQWLAWTAILIDYFEVPVIISTLKKLVRTIKQNPYAAVAVLLERD